MRYLAIVLSLFLIAPVFAIDETKNLASLTWPLPMPTEEQLEEARNCEFTLEEIEGFEPETACEWMALAMAHAASLGEEEALPEEALDAYTQAVLLNPALPLHFDVLVMFWNKLGDTLPMPDFVEQPIESVQIRYDFAGTTHYELEIGLKDGEYRANADVMHTPYAGDATEYTLEDESLDAELIEGLALGMSDLVPIGHIYTDQPCWHIISDWTVNLVFEDGTEISMRTYESNVLSAGGFWQTIIDEQAYLQVSPAFLTAVVEIHEELELPWGEVASYGCGENQSPLEAGF